MSLSYYYWISKSLFDELLNKLREHKHIALIAPRESAKAVVLFEIKRLAEMLPEFERPKVVILRATELFGLDELEFLKAIAGKLQVTAPEFSVTEEHPLVQRLFEIVASAVRAHAVKSQSLWLFVQNLTELPSPFARALLTVFQWAAEDDELRRRLAVGVSGSTEFVPLTYTQNSPYRHAEKFFLLGLDREYVEIFFRARASGDSLVNGFNSAAKNANIEIDSDALDLLEEQTGGYAKFIEEIVVTTKRPGPMPDTQGSESWTKVRIERLIDRFIKEYMHKEYDGILSLSEVESDPDAWELLQQLVDGYPQGIRLPGTNPHMLEIAGIARRGDDGIARIASPIWLRFLQARMTKLHRADRYALLGDWEQAWKLYEGQPGSISDRVLDGIRRYSLNDVLDAWGESLIDAISTGPSRVWRQFSQGARHLLGFSWIKRFDSDSLRVVVSDPPGSENTPLSDSSPFEAVGVGVETSIRVALRTDRRCLESSFNGDPEQNHLMLNLAIQLGRTSGPEIDSSSLTRIRKSLRRFWHAYSTATQNEFASRIGSLREKHLLAIREINQLLSQHPGDMKTVVQKTAKTLVETAGYYRILICLVSPKRDRIQAVASHCQEKSRDFNFHTDYPLNAETPEADWDVQQWVAIKGETAMILNASDPNLCSPRTQWENVRQIGMEAIAIVPIKFSGSIETLGTIHFERRDKRLPELDEIQAFNVLASQIAVAFDQARRTTLLEQTLHRLNDQIRCIASDGRNVLFRNRAALLADNVKVDAWGTPTGCPPVEPPSRPEMNYEEDQYGHIWEVLRAPIVDFTSALPPPFKQCDGQIGVVDQRHELTELLLAYKAFQKWMSGSSCRDTAGRIVNSFRGLDAKWCRIYLIKKSAVGTERLESFAQFGIRDKRVRASFENGDFQTVKNEPDHQAWFLLNTFRRPAVFRYDPTHRGEPRKDHHPTGVPAFVTYDHWREAYEKNDEYWIEAPLIVGLERIGLIVFSMPEDFSPKRYEQIRWWVGGVAVALRNAIQSEHESEQKQEEAYRSAAELAVHQLSNRLGPAESACVYAQNWLAKGDAGHHNAVEQLRRAQQSLAAARDILKNFEKYASGSPLPDIQVHRVADLMLFLEQKLRGYTPAPRRIETLTDGGNEKVRVSDTVLAEVLEILLNNSVMHSGKSPAELEIQLKAEVRESQPKGTRYLEIDYRDNGRGIAENIRHRIFDPFFTTHARGNGLGLVIAESFVTRLNGIIKEAGTVGSGVCFRISLPVVNSGLPESGEPSCRM